MLNRYQVVLNRLLAITVEADDPISATRIAEFFISNKDESTESDRKINNFKIDSIEISGNDAIEVC